MAKKRAEILGLDNSTADLLTLHQMETAKPEFEFRFSQRVNLPRHGNCFGTSGTVQQVKGPTTAVAQCDNCLEMVNVG